MSEKREAYGVFLMEGDKETLIFSDEGAYALYERRETARAFKKEMKSRWDNTTYKVKEVVIEVKADD